MESAKIGPNQIMFQLMAIVFYILLLIWLFFKIKNVIQIRKYNYKNEVKIVKDKLKETKLSKCLLIISIIFLSAPIIIILSFLFLFAVGILFLVFGWMFLINDGVLSKIVSFVLALPTLYFKEGFSIFLDYFWIFYICPITWFIRGININYHISKQIKSWNRK